MTLYMSKVQMKIHKDVIKSVWSYGSRLNQ